jgi:hypothetical protein
MKFTLFFAYLDIEERKKPLILRSANSVSMRGFYVYGGGRGLAYCTH